MNRLVEGETLWHRAAVPAYLHLISIDWHVDEAPAALYPAIAAASQNCESKDHTLQTFLEQLTAHAQAHPEIMADALIDDGYHQLVLVVARAGHVRSTYVEERPENAAGPVALPYGELASVELVRDREALAALLSQIDRDIEIADGGAVELPTVYDNEDQLRAVSARVAAAIDTGGGRFIADADRDSFLVEISPGHATVTRLVVMTAPELVARLLARQYTPAPPAGRDPGGRYAAVLYWPADLLEFLQREAQRADRSLSYLVQYAFKLAHGQISASTREELALAAPPVTAGVKRQQTLYFSGAILDAIEAEAHRLDSSLSFVAQTSVALSRADLAALPHAPEP